MMKPAFRVCAMVPGLLFSAMALAAPYPSADQLRKAVMEISVQLRPEKMEVEILDARKAGVALPLMAAGLRLGDGVCTVYVNGNPEDELVQFFNAVPAQDLPVWLNSIAAHELTHCIEQREAYIRRHFDLVLPPEMPGEKLTIQGYLSVVKSGTVEMWGEALADIVSVLYFRQAVPERWEEFANTLAALRSSTGGKWPDHDTSAWLHKVIASGADKPKEQSLFETAFRLRRQYRPDSAEK